MTNLTTTAGLVKKFAFVPIVLLIVIILIVLIALRYSSKKPTLPQVEIPKIEVFPGQNATFNIQNLKQPSSTPPIISVYEIDREKNFLLEAQVLASILNFREDPADIADVNFGGGKVYSKLQESLVIYKSTVTYKNSTVYPQSPALTTGELQAKAGAFLSQIGFNAQNPKVSFAKISGEDIIKTSNPEDADFARFSFSYSLDDFPVISPSNDLSITYDFSGNLSSFTLINFKAGNPKGQYPVISFKEAVQNVVSGGASLVKIEGTKEDSASTKNIGEVIIDEAYLGYYLPSFSVESTLPVWVFEGRVEKQNDSLNVTYILPAVESALIKN